VPSSCYDPRALSDNVNSRKGFLERCAELSRSGAVWVALGVAFLVLGISSSSGAYIGLGAAFLAIGIGRTLRRRRPSAD
jgi:hypothetical protein